jgi:hypothetical protein
MALRNWFRLLATLALACIVSFPASAAVRKPSNTYTLRVVCFTATPKSPKIAKIKSFGEIIKQSPILPESGAPFVLDLSTPARFLRQIQNASKDYDFTLVAGGTVTCENKAICPIDIPPSPDDRSKAGFTGEWSLTVKDPSTIKLDIRELTLNMLLPGQTKVLPVQTAKTIRTVSLNRTYVLGGTAKQENKVTTLRIFAVSISPGG